MTEEDLRDCFAMFALAGVVMINKEPYDDQAVAELAYSLADNMLIARKKKEKNDEEDSGIVAVVPKRQRKR